MKHDAEAEAPVTPPEAPGTMDDPTESDARASAVAAVRNGADVRVPARHAPDVPVAGVPVARPAPGEVGGPKGPEPTRYGDWENKGRATDF